MLKVAQGRPQVAPSNPRVAQIDRQVAQNIPPPTLCIGAPGLHYVMGGGWELCTQSVIVKRVRDNRYRGGRLVTLPYLKLV